MLFNRIVKDVRNRSTNLLVPFFRCIAICFLKQGPSSPYASVKFSGKCGSMVADEIAHDLLVININEIVNVIPHRAHLEDGYIVFLCRHCKDRVENQIVFYVIKNVEAVYRALINVLRLTSKEFSALASHVFKSLDS